MAYLAQFPVDIRGRVQLPRWFGTPRTPPSPWERGVETAAQVAVTGAIIADIFKGRRKRRAPPPLPPEPAVPVFLPRARGITESPWFWPAVLGGLGVVGVMVLSRRK